MQIFTLDYTHKRNGRTSTLYAEDKNGLLAMVSDGVINLAYKVPFDRLYNFFSLSTYVKFEDGSGLFSIGMGEIFVDKEKENILADFPQKVSSISEIQKLYGNRFMLDALSQNTNPKVRTGINVILEEEKEKLKRVSYVNSIEQAQKLMLKNSYAASDMASFFYK